MDGVTEDVRRGALDWAYSVQVRYADIQAADLVKVTNFGTDAPDRRSLLHKAKVQATMAALGVKSSDWNSWRTEAAPLNDLDDVFVRRVIENHFRRLQEALEPQQRAKLGEIILSSLPSGSVSAFCAINTWDHFRYVFIDAEVIHLCTLAAKAISVCLAPLVGLTGLHPTTENRRCIQMAQSADLQRRFLDLFGSMVVLRTARAAEPWLPDVKFVPGSILLTNAMELFVIAHEVAHVVAGHFDRAAHFDAEIVSPEGGEGLAFAHADEFEADALGLLLTKSAMLGAGVEGLYPQLAPYIFLKCIQVLYASEAVFQHTDPASPSSHPDPGTRALRLRELSLSVSAAPSQLEAVYTRVDQVFFHLSRSTTAGLERARKAGVKPRPKRSFRSPDSSRPTILGMVSAAEPLSIDQLRSFLDTEPR